MDALPEQRRRLVALGRADLLDRFDRAADCLDAYVRALAVVDLGPLRGAASSPNVVRDVRTRTGRAAVLKLVGRVEVGEAATLAAWHRHGVPAPALLDSGVDSHVEGVSHLLLTKLRGHSVSHAEMCALTDRAVATFQVAHITPPEQATRLADFLGERIKETTASWTAAGYVPPVDLHGCVPDGHHRPVLLHGDVVGHNLLVDGDTIALIDPAGVKGPAEFDAARWLGRAAVATGPAGIATMSASALNSDLTLDRSVFETLLGLELAIEVSYRLDSRADVIERGADPRSFDYDTEAFIQLAVEFLTRTSRLLQ